MFLFLELEKSKMSCLDRHGTERKIQNFKKTYSIEQLDIQQHRESEIKPMSPFSTINPHLTEQPIIHSSLATISVSSSTERDNLAESLAS